MPDSRTKQNLPSIQKEIKKHANTSQKSRNGKNPHENRRPQIRSLQTHKRKSKPILHRPPCSPKLPRRLHTNMRLLRRNHNKRNRTQKLQPHRRRTNRRHTLRQPNRLQPQKTLPIRPQRHTPTRKTTQSRRHPRLRQPSPTRRRLSHNGVNAEKSS